MFNTLRSTRQRLQPAASTSMSTSVRLTTSAAAERRRRAAAAECSSSKGTAQNITSHRDEPEEGSTAVELAILTPIVLLLVLLVVQLVLFIHARQVVTAAAEQGVRSERLSRTDGGEGVQAALGFASRLGGQAVTGVDAQVSRGLDSVTVNVSGEGQSIIPWMRLRVSGTSSGAIDQWTGDNS